MTTGADILKQTSHQVYLNFLKIQLKNMCDVNKKYKSRL